MRVRIGDERASATVLMMIAVPLIVGLMAMVIGIGQVAVMRARMQVAADRAAFAGASVFAHVMNRVAQENWRIDRAYRDLRRDFESDTQQDRGTARQRRSRYEAARDAALANIDSVLSGMSARAEDAAAQVFFANAPYADARIIVRNGVGYSVREDPSEQWADVSYYYVEGGSSFIDPESVEGGRFRVLKHLLKRPGHEAHVGVRAKAAVRPLVMPWLFGGEVVTGATSAAQAFGGSAGRFAQKDAETIEEAQGLILDDGSDGLYRAATVPVWTMGEMDGDMHH